MLLRRNKYNIICNTIGLVIYVGIFYFSFFLGKMYVFANLHDFSYNNPNVKIKTFIASSHSGGHFIIMPNTHFVSTNKLVVNRNESSRIKRTKIGIFGNKKK